mmetsp:Transcript_5980/g.15203  ORF Transcript_5980/g.15203 Transcript_5980/m.15203 type:complete len:215 (-) Transcript_5980:8-652(-)
MLSKSLGVAFACIISPATISSITSAISPTTSASPSRASSRVALARRKSPLSTATLFPSILCTAFAPLLVSARSITSSCSSDAAWIISTTCASRACAADGSPPPAAAAEASSTSVGRKLLPPRVKKCRAASWSAGWSAATSVGSSSRSGARRGSTRAKAEGSERGAPRRSVSAGWPCASFGTGGCVERRREGGRMAAAGRRQGESAARARHGAMR